MLHSILFPGETFRSPVPGFVDVRDVAEAQVAGIKTPGHHRVLIGSSEWFDLRDAVDHLTTARPELKGRLANPVPMGRAIPAVDNARVIDLLGIPVTPWRKTVEDGIDYLLKVEEEWKEAGVDHELKFALLAIGAAVSGEVGQAQA